MRHGIDTAPENNEFVSLKEPAYLYPSLTALLIGLNVVAFVEIDTAYPHDPKQPELKEWFKSLKNKAGQPCCDDGDGHYVEAEWDATRSGYRVLLKHPHRPNEPAQWFDVPYAVVIEKPNLSGRAMVWWWPSYGIDGTMTPHWRCFIPGPKG
jgi:hypothetical protein